MPFQHIEVELACDQWCCSNCHGGRCQCDENVDILDADTARCGMFSFSEREKTFSDMQCAELFIDDVSNNSMFKFYSFSDKSRHFVSVILRGGKYGILQGPAERIATVKRDFCMYPHTENGIGFIPVNQLELELV